MPNGIINGITMMHITSYNRRLITSSGMILSNIRGQCVSCIQDEEVMVEVTSANHSEGLSVLESHNSGGKINTNMQFRCKLRDKNEITMKKRYIQDIMQGNMLIDFNRTSA